MTYAPKLSPLFLLEETLRCALDARLDQRKTTSFLSDVRVPSRVRAVTTYR